MIFLGALPFKCRRQCSVLTRMDSLDRFDYARLLPKKHVMCNREVLTKLKQIEVLPAASLGLSTMMKPQSQEKRLNLFFSIIHI